MAISGNAIPLASDTRGYASGRKRMMTIPAAVNLPDLWKEEKCVAMSYIHVKAIMHQKIVIMLE